MRYLCTLLTHSSMDVHASTQSMLCSAVITYDTMPPTFSPQWDWLSVSHCLAMEVATTAAFFVTAGYWLGIVALAQGGGSRATSTSSILAHAANSGVAFAQIALTRLPMVSVHFQVLLLYASAYISFLWLYGAASGTWRYGLMLQRARPAAVYILMPLVAALVFGVWSGAAAGRERVLYTMKNRCIEDDHQGGPPAGRGHAHAVHVHAGGDEG